MCVGCLGICMKSVRKECVCVCGGGGCLGFCMKSVRKEYVFVCVWGVSWLVFEKCKKGLCVCVWRGVLASV